jgi:uroporphyrinogen decarboxylase
MTPKERAVAALECRCPDDIVPTFELVYFLGPEKFGRDWTENISSMSPREQDRYLHEHAELHVMIAEEYDYSILRSDYLEAIRIFKKWGLDKTYLLCGEADGTMAIPNGHDMVEVAAALRERPDEIHAQFQRSVEGAIKRGEEFREAGAEAVTMCADYCFNDGPFLSPTMFREFVTPYLSEIIAGHRANGLYTIKHTDGDIMPILDQLLEANPHALHSIDPQAGVDLAEVKRLAAGKTCLCGNVNCGLLQTGTDDEVRQDVLRSLRDGMPGGGYIFATSNCAFRGMPLERYEMMMSLRKEFGRYDLKEIPRN